MQSDTLTRFNAIEDQRRTTKARALALSEAQLTRKETADAWSIQQIAEHLVLSDETLGQA